MGGGGAVQGMQKGHGRPALIQADGVGSGGRPADPASGPSKPSQRRACTRFWCRAFEGGVPLGPAPWKRLASPVQSGRCLPLTSIPEMKPRTTARANAGACRERSQSLAVSK